MDYFLLVFGRRFCFIYLVGRERGNRGMVKDFLEAVQIIPSLLYLFGLGRDCKAGSKENVSAKEQA